MLQGDAILLAEFGCRRLASWDLGLLMLFYREYYSMFQSSYVDPQYHLWWSHGDFLLLSVSLSAL
jgi:hypothetical protein